MNINNKKKYFANLFTRILFLIIFLLFILILNKYNRPLIITFKDNLFNKSLSFIKINKLSQKLLGKDVFYYQNYNDSIEVLATDFNLSSKEKYLNGEKITVSDNLPIGSISSGVVVFTGNKDEYKNTVIIQGLDGYNIWYGNLKDINVSLYDYIEEHSLLGAANNNYIYLIIEKNDKFYTYEEYIKNKN